MVKRVISLVYGEIRGLHQAAYILAVFAVGSQLLALIRDRLLAHNFGTSGELDLYYAAFRIPDLLFVLFASVLSVYVLLPFVTEARAKFGAKAGAEVLSQFFSLFLVVYCLAAVVLFFTVPYLVPILFPGFSADTDILVTLIRLLLVQPFLLGLSSLFGVITQLSHRFVLYAISPLIYNVGIIIGIVAFYPYWGIAGIVYGVILGAFGHMLLQYPLVRQSPLCFGLITNLTKIDPSLIKEVLLVAVPRALTLSIHQIVLLVIVGMASLMAAGSVSVFQFAFNLQSVPLAVIGMSYSVAAFPVLADLFAKQNRVAFNHHVITAVRHIIFWSVPMIALVIVIRAQIVRVVLGSGLFGWNDTRLTAALLAVFVVSLLAQALLLLLVRTFYAGGNTRLPLLIAGIGATVSIALASVLLVVLEKYPHLISGFKQVFRLEGVSGTEIVVLAAAFSIGVLVELAILLVASARVYGLPWLSLGRQLAQALAAAMVAGVAAYCTLSFIVVGINQETFVGILLQGTIAGLVGVLAAALTYYWLGSEELKEMYQSLHTKFKKSEVVAPQTEVP